MENVIITNIVWDVDSPEELDGLPTTVEMEYDTADYDGHGDSSQYFADQLSDQYGFCVTSLEVNFL